MPLKLSLKPGEKFVLNGAVVQNGDRRGVLILQNKASVLREKDIMQAEEANTPSRRVYFLIMMMYLDESNAADLTEEVSLRLGEFMDAIYNPDILAECLNIQTYLVGSEYYKGLMTCRKLIDYEDERLGRHVTKGVSDDGRAG